jgi:hypothetical protein
MTMLVAYLSWPLALAVIAIGLALTVFVMQIRQSRAATYHLDIARLEQDHQRIDMMVTQMEMFCSLVEKSLSGRLHAPTHKGLDSLLQKLQEGTITADECVTLHGYILERADELVIEGIPAPDLEFPRLMTLWAIKIRLSLSGYRIEEPVGMSPLPPHDTPLQAPKNRGEEVTRPHDL